MKGTQLAALTSLILLGLVPFAQAHGIVGNRMFIEPMITEDANVKNELVLPSFDLQALPDGTWRSIGFSFEKILYPRRLSVVLESDRIYQHANGGRLAGWDNFEMGVKWQGLTSERHEFTMSPALFVTFPTGSRRMAERQTALRPMLLYAKGFGDLPASWIRSFALQGDIGYEASVSGSRDRQFVFDEVLMYSVPYLNQFVRHDNDGYSMEHSLRRGFSNGAFFGNLFPFVELNGASAVNGVPGGTSLTLRPGVLWMGKYAQVSVAADLPVRTPGMVRPHTGASILVDWFLDEIVPPLNWTPFGKQHHHDD
ncbi:MAG: hypothetical protein ACM3NO_11105 [Deltaproteobacteria bacterium]